MKKFIKGTFELDKDVTDIVAYEEKKKDKLLALVEWCDDAGIAMMAGVADDNTYLCEYKIVGRTKTQCQETLREFKKQLRGCFPYVSLVFQGYGDCL